MSSISCKHKEQNCFTYVACCNTTRRLVCNPSRLVWIEGRLRPNSDYALNGGIWRKGNDFLKNSGFRCLEPMEFMIERNGVWIHRDLYIRMQWKRSVGTNPDRS